MQRECWLRCFIILPCFNEEKDIKPLIHSIDKVLKNEISYKIIAVNDGSYDRTSEILKDLSAEYPVSILNHSVNMGLGAALNTGLLAAAEEALDDDFIITMDSDNTHDPMHVLDMLIVARNADVVIGSRYIKGGLQLNVPLYRVILSKIVNFLVRTLFRISIKDTTSGFRCFKARLLKQLCRTFKKGLISSDGFEAPLELLLKVVGVGGFITEVPICLDYEKKVGRSKMRLFSTIINYSLLLLKFRQLNKLKRFS